MQNWDHTSFFFVSYCIMGIFHLRFIKIVQEYGFKWLYNITSTYLTLLKYYEIS